MDKYEADSEPLALALTKIAALTDRSESDPQLMVDLLNEIIEVSEAAKLAYRDNVIAAQKAGLAGLWKATSA